MEIKMQSLICHTVGAEDHVPKKNRGYRNHYCASIGSEDFDTLEALVQRGCMVKGRTINNGLDQFFHATESGCLAIGLHKAAIKRAMKID